MRRKAGTVRQLITAMGAASLLTAASVQAQPTVTFGGIELQVNATPNVSGNPTLEGSALRMSNGEYGAARSAISTATYNLLNANWFTSYTTRFSCQGVGNADGYDEPICTGDGIGFVVTGGSASQIGGGGQDMGYAGSFENSLAFAFQTFWRELLLGQNGSLTQVTDKPFGDVNENYQGLFNVSLSYDAANQSLASTITNGITTISQTHNGIMLGDWSEEARIGFTASSGLASEYSWVSDWTFEYTPPSTTVPEPSTWTLMLIGLFSIGLLARRRHWAA
ncbi:MAG TPA: PEP-CTERM sorting domain-containing protein [Gemmatimonas sp.]|uniref:PEP-CTERM sorting domain-containing protein n=1 Tax=Gemmatimonas sp. TaxID=1962908 RepID=UPI002ED898B6